MAVSFHGIVVNIIFVACVYKSGFFTEATGSRLKVRSIPESKLMVIQFTNLSCAHAESPVWDERTQTLYWVDTANRQVHALDYPSLTHRSKKFGYGEVNIVVPVDNSSRLLVAVRSELYLMDWQKPGDSALRLVAAMDVGRPNNLLNEGKADATGRFWVGTKGSQVGDEVAPDEATFYSLETPNFVPRVQLRPVSISNGLVWARNNSVLYYIDSGTKKIQAFDFDLRKGHISNGRTVLDVEKRGFKNTIPDGMTIDKDGMLWIALMFNGSTTISLLNIFAKFGFDPARNVICKLQRNYVCMETLLAHLDRKQEVIRVDPNTKEILELYKLPVSRVTSVAWMGKNMDTLVITTSRRNLAWRALEEQPLAGSLFILRNCTTSGMPDHKFYFQNADDY